MADRDIRRSTNRDKDNDENRLDNTNGKKNQYVDLKLNGRIFPSYMLLNYKKYHLPPISVDPNKDPCETKDNKKDQRMYQQFLAKYMDFKGPNKDILIYHGTGSGKTNTAINIYNALYNYNPNINMFLLIKASLKGSWLNELQSWLQKDEYEHRYKNIIFINYDSPFADRNFLEAVKNVDSSKKSVYIIDEVHNFIRNVYSNISSNVGKRAQVIYDYIIQEKRDNPDTRVILLSATPAINNPYELALLFNLLRPGIFPRSESQFNHLFITDANYQTINYANKNMLQRRIMGLVSFYIGATPDLYATKTIIYVDIKMSQLQEDVYDSFEQYEEKIARNSRNRDKKGPSMYKSYTRQAANFVFPPISQRINGEARPRPGKFRITEREATKLIEGKDVGKLEKTGDKVLDVNKYIQALNAFTDGLDAYYHDINKKDIESKHTIMDDIKTFATKYNGVFSDFDEKEKKTSGLYKSFRESSGKMTCMIFNIMISPGPTLVYSNYVLMEGLQIFKILLKYVGFYDFMTIKDKPIKDKLGYVEFDGSIKDIAERYKRVALFNQPDNKDGNLIRIIMISPAGSEGISLKNVRQVHIMEPYWNEVRIDQMIGRAIRQCSHSALKMEDRHVDVFRYKSVRGKVDKITTDQYIEDVARTKDGLIQSFLDAIKEVAIDCVLNKNHNMLVQEYKCFQFEEPSLFNKYVGPAYKEDIYDDMKIDNGSNSTKAMTIKIKVMKIQAVKLLNIPSETNPPEYSKIANYWYYPKTGTVYDYELHYAIGKISYSEENIPMKLDKDTYIIDKLINIPMIE